MMALEDMPFWWRVFHVLRQIDSQTPAFDTVQLISDSFTRDRSVVHAKGLFQYPNGSKKMVFARWLTIGNEIESAWVESA